MMFSDFVHALRSVISLPAGAFIPLLSFALVFWFLAKVFRAVVLQGHWFMLSLVAFVTVSVLLDQLRDGQIVLALVCAIPLVFVGREMYRRLLGS